MPVDDSLITVAIPTYNRPEHLRRCVELLACQTNNQFSLLILDNASPEPAEEVLRHVLPSFPRARVIRNLVNVGGDANIMRCFEFCDTEFVWVLGDDDEPIETAIATILETIREYPDAIFFNFQCDLYPRSKDRVSHDLESFISSIDSYSNVLFISTSVYRRQSVVQFLPMAYEYSYAMAGQIVLVLRALASAPATCALLTKRIVKWIPPPNGIAWSAVRHMLGLGILLDLPLSSVARTQLARLISSPRALEYLTVHLLGYLREDGDRTRASHAMEQMYHRLLAHSGSPGIGIRYMFYRYVLLRFPNIGVAMFQTVSKLSGRGKLAFDFRDPFR
jgi:glycosyltransferase involved in cell wall biosynthesis